MFDVVVYSVKIVSSFYKVVALVGTKYVFCFKFPKVCFCQELAKLNDI